MVIVSSTVAVNYYLISFLAVTFDRPYMQVFFSSIAEILAYATSGIVYRKLGARSSMSLSLAISTLGGYATWIISSRCSDSVLTILVMLCKFGISGTYNIQLCAMSEVYPSSFLATGFGSGHFFAVIF